ncbi:MAG TPA: RagB/SusD family nutrient uptake outer membrane protein [Paludibacter sp.]|nr:RagB/SusD family nutrient uptake outer membrane protein [Paludibacter sp.]
MKNIKYIFFALSLLLLAPGCSDFLDLKPENDLLLDDYWKKGSDVESVVRACYRTMQEDDFMSRVIIWGELRGDNVITNTSAGDDEKQIDNVNILPTNGDCKWTSFYTVINYCNTVLKYAPGVMKVDKTFTINDLHAKEAEVLAIRSLCYFYLVRTYRDVPLSLDATISDDQNLSIPKSSPVDVLQKITTDLLQAEQWALESYPTIAGTKGRITKDAVRAILADVYLWRQDYGNCIAYCDKLLNATSVTMTYTGKTIVLPKYPLVNELYASSSSSSFLSSDLIFNEGNSSESIFELQFSVDKKNDRLSKLYGVANNVGQLTATTSYAAENSPIFTNKDQRRIDFIKLDKTQSGQYGILKYLGYNKNDGSVNPYSYKVTTSNWIFYRITDIMLMKAEALVQQAGTDENLKKALQIVNTTYKRANPTDSLEYKNYNSPDAMEKLVLLERQRELMFEGKRWFDLVRMAERKNSTNDLVDYVINKYTGNLKMISTKLSVMNAIYLPIPQNELIVNKELKQNPYYEMSNDIVK